jgi:DNA-binding response OmpR family regulator
MYSAETGQKAQNISLEAGADDFISKPASLSYLHKSLVPYFKIS